MTSLRRLLTRVRKDESGATMVEYSILIGIITVAAIVAIGTMGGRVSNAWNSLVTATATSM